MDHFTTAAVLRNLSGFLHWKTTVRNLEDATRQALAPDRLPSEFLPHMIDKRVSAYPWEIAMIRANHLRWQPLPVIQAYSAYTPALDLLNAQALETASGPEEILLSLQTIDGRVPFFETPLSWRTLLSWYDLQDESPKLDLLTRRSIPRFSNATPIAGDNVAHWDRRITLPTVGDDELLMMGADIEESWKGILKRNLLRSPAIDVHAEFRSGRTKAGRALRSNMQSGVIVSDWPRDLGDLAPMLTGAGTVSRDRVVAIVLCTQSPSDFNPTIRIHWSRVKLRPATSY